MSDVSRELALKMAVDLLKTSASPKDSAEALELAEAVMSVAGVLEDWIKDDSRRDWERRTDEWLGKIAEPRCPQCGGPWPCSCAARPPQAVGTALASTAVFIARRVHESRSGRTREELGEMLPSHDLGTLGAALAFAEGNTWVVVDGSHVRPGSGRPL